MEPESLYFFSALQRLLECPDFLPKGGLLAFTCTHAYPHVSCASAPSLDLALKDLDMLVFQALKRLTGSASVTHALDDHEFREDSWEPESSEDEGPSGRESPQPYTTPATLGTHIRGPIMLDGLDDGYPNPEELRYYNEVMGGARRADEPAYFQRHVTWLNHSPQDTTAREVAVAYLTYGNEPGMGVYYSSAVIVADFRKSQGS